MTKTADLTPLQRRRRVKKCWDHMFDRCYNPRCMAYERYGAKGIKVAERWYDFDSFYKDVGDPETTKLSIDRIDNSGNYEPGNVRWATAREQALNQATSALSIIMDNGVRISQTEAAERLQCLPRSIAKRLAKLRKKGKTTFELEDLRLASNRARRSWGLEPI